MDEPMPHHACFAVPDQDLDVVVVDDSKTMQGILRSILLSMKVKRIRVYDSADQAVHGMLSEPPNLILSEWQIGGTSGQQFLHMLRARFMDPLCFVPVIVITAGATANILEKAMISGAHLLLVKPISPASLMERIAWLQRDSRPFVLGSRGAYEIEGINERVKTQKDRSQALRRATSYRANEAVAATPVKLEEDNAVLRQAERWQAFLKAKEGKQRPPAPKPIEATLRDRTRTVFGTARGA